MHLLISAGSSAAEMPAKELLITPCMLEMSKLQAYLPVQSVLGVSVDRDMPEAIY